MSVIQPTRVENVTPNAVFAPSIQFSTTIVNGKLVTSALISFMQAQVTNHGEPNVEWKRATKDGWLQIDDINNLPADLASLQGDVQIIYGSLFSVLGAANTIRQIV